MMCIGVSGASAHKLLWSWMESRSYCVRAELALARPELLITSPASIHSACINRATRPAGGATFGTGSEPELAFQ